MTLRYKKRNNLKFRSWEIHFEEAATRLQKSVEGLFHAVTPLAFSMRTTPFGQVEELDSSVQYLYGKEEMFGFSYIIMFFSRFGNV